MAKLNQDKSTFRSRKNLSRNSDYYWPAFFHLLKVNWGISILGPAFLVYCSIPLLLILAASSIYYEDIKESQRPEITVFLAEDVSSDKAVSLSRMAAALSVTHEITIIEPKTAAKQVAETLGLSTELQEEIKFPRTLHIVFPKNADPIVMKELAQLLAKDSRVTDMHSTVETYRLFQRVRSHWLILLSAGFCFTGVISFVAGYLLISIISRPHLPELSTMFLLGIPDLENSRPLQVFGFIFGVLYLFGCIAIYPALEKGVTISADWLFYFNGLGNPKLDSPDGKVLISLGFLVVSYALGVSLSIRNTHVSIRKLALQN